MAALVELKARFDEQANIEWARELEEAGVHVVYGLVGLKIHTKTALVVRDEADGIRRYCHVGTGNYNPKTAKLYEDLGLAHHRRRSRLRPHAALQLPHRLRPQRAVLQAARRAAFLRHRIMDLISPNEAAQAEPGSGRIRMKLNSLVDADMIEALYAASQAGVQIDFIVRGICCLRPGVPGMSENIRVRSIVGRYLEHSRIYGFAQRRGARRAGVLHRVGRPDASQPRSPGRGARPP